MSSSEIKFIPNSEFESATEQDFEAIDVELYAAEEDFPRSPSRKRVAETFLDAVEQSRLLTFEGEQFLFKRLNYLRFRASALQATIHSGRHVKKTQAEIDRLLSDAYQTREQIARANFRLVTSIARRFGKTNEEFDEYLAEANIILLNAIDKFDYARGYRFSTYATHAVQRRIFRLIDRRNKRGTRERSVPELILSASICDPDRDELTEAEILETVNEIVANFDRTLDEREQFVIRGRFGLDGSGKCKTFRELGEVLNLSKERVRQILQQSIEKLAVVIQPPESMLTE